VGTRKELKIGDQVKLKDGAERIEVNDFDSLPQAFYFAPGDVAKVFTVNSPRLRKKKGFPDTQTVVQFTKMNYAGVEMELIARVETKDLVRLPD
jgi:hypothetical protein